jgi:hypothetical protein
VIGEFSAEETAKKEIRLVRAIDELALYSEDHSVLFNMIVTDILVSPSRLARGGSTSQAIGAIWANPDPTFTINDVMEILVHELTHHTMFLDELRYGHYFYSNVIDRSSWARSAILKSVRPLDKVLHSIVVAVEVLLFRCRCIWTPDNSAGSSTHRNAGHSIAIFHLFSGASGSPERGDSSATGPGVACQCQTDSD